MNRWTVRTLFSGGLVERKSNAAMRDDTIPGEFSAPEPPAPIEEKGEMTPARFEGVIRRFVDGVRDVFTVRTVYGEPIEAHGVTVVPGAQTYFGFGGGGGSGRNPAEGGTQQGVGGGLGGGGGGR